MFGLSITKILFTVGIVVAVWRGWKWVEILRDKIGDDPEPKPDKPTRRARASQWFKKPSTKPSPPAPPAVDLVPCPHCGAYIASGTYCDDPSTCPVRLSKAAGRKG